MSNAICRLTIRNTGNDGRPSYEVRLGDSVERTTSQSRVRDLIRSAARTCAEAGTELVIEAPDLSPALVQAWRARLKPPVGP